MLQETVHFTSTLRRSHTGAPLPDSQVEAIEGVPLSGVLHRPADRNPRGHALFAHCATGAGTVEAALDIIKSLCDQGLGVLRIAVTGHGEGDISGSPLSSSVADLVAAARFLEREHAAPVLLIAHSTAADAILHAVPEISSTRAVAIIGAPVDATWQETLHTRGCGLLLLHSPTDSAAGTGVVLAAWAASYLDPVDKADIDHDEPVIARIGASGLRTDMTAGGLPLVADEPRSAGGTAAGPTPYGYLSAALASCTAMTLRMYANHKKLDLRGVEVRVRHDKIHADDCENCDKRAGKIDHFRRELRLHGDLDDAQRRRLVEIANRCPVHRTLHSEIAIQTTLLDD